jgi:hypothetical protein
MTAPKTVLTCLLPILLAFIAPERPSLGEAEASTTVVNSSGKEGHVRRREGYPENWLWTVKEIQEALRGAEEIRVYRMAIMLDPRSTDPGRLEDQPLVVLSERSHRDMFRLLKQETRFPAKRIGKKEVLFTIFVFISKGKTSRAGYSFTTGRLVGGKTSEFGVVPQAFKRSLLELHEQDLTGPMSL